MRQALLPVLALACAGIAAPSHAQDAATPLATAYTDLAPQLCGATNKSRAAAGSYTCRGVGDLNVVVTSENGKVSATLSRRAAPSPRPQIEASRKIGDRIEWLGRRDGRTFEPLAAIVRVTNDANGEAGVLIEVLRIAGDDVCPAGFVDAASAPRPNDAARRLADEVAASFHCGVDKPRIVGPVTTLARAAMERLG